MSADQTIPSEKPMDLVTVTFLVEGQAVAQEVQVLSYAVTKAVNTIGTARVTLSDGDAAKEDFAHSTGENFLPGKKVEIKAGYHSEEKTIFKGVIIRHSITVGATGTTMVLDCRDEAVKMTVGRKNAYFYEKKDSEIISEIGGNYGGLSIDAEATSTKHKEMVQYYCTDWDFIVSRAEQNGMLVYDDDGEVKVAKPDLSAEPVLKLRFGATILSFSAEMDARHQFKAVKGVGWSQADQALLEVDGATPSLTEAGNLSSGTLADVVGIDPYLVQHGGSITDVELQAWADATFMRGQLAKVQGMVKFHGIDTVKPGTVLEIGGVGDRFNGKVFVSGVLHELMNGTWETTVEFGLSPKWFARKYQDIMDLPAGGLLPGINGLHVGKVVALEGDPDGEDRIQVRMPTISPSDDGIWSRLATLDAGNNRGWVFRPEIDDEVVVGFMNADPRFPVVLGHLHSSKSPSPIPGSDDNHEKGLVTRSEMRLHFDDDKKVITIETPGGNKIVLSEDAGGITVEDQNGNKMEMTSDGINLESPGAITVKATKDLSLEGMNVNIKASAQLKAEGSAGAELSTGAICVVKGSMVQIN